MHMKNTCKHVHIVDSTACGHPPLLQENNKNNYVDVIDIFVGVTSDVTEQ